MWLQKFEISWKISPFLGWLVDWLTILTSLFLVMFQNVENFSINPTNAKVFTERRFSSFSIFWKSDFALQNMLLFLRKSTNFATNCRILYFPREWYFSNALFFFINTLLFYWKSAKFTTNCRNINFSRGWYFLNACPFLFFLFFFEKLPYFIANRQNSLPIVKI